MLFDCILTNLIVPEVSVGVCCVRVKMKRRNNNTHTSKVASVQVL